MAGKSLAPCLYAPTRDAGRNKGVSTLRTEILRFAQRSPFKLLKIGVEQIEGEPDVPEDSVLYD